MSKTSEIERAKKRIEIARREVKLAIENLVNAESQLAVMLALADVRAMFR